MVRVANESDINQLALIHFEELRNDFLPSLGIHFLRKLYKGMLLEKNIRIYVDKKGSVITGFVVGSLKFDETFVKIISKNLIAFIAALIYRVVVNPFVIIKIIQTFFYTNYSRAKNVDAELVVIAVDRKYHRIGIGKKLVINIEDYFLKNEINNYKVTVNSNNSKANKFYRSLNFTKKGHIFIYGKKLNLYIKSIK